MRTWFVALAILGTLAACSADSSGSLGNDGVDADAAEVEVTDSIEAPDDVETPSELCSRMWSRLMACGHFYTFPTFEQVCADFAPAEIETLRKCSVRVCAGLFECVRDELHVPTAGN